MQSFGVIVLVAAFCLGSSALSVPPLGDLLYGAASTFRVVKYLCFSCRKPLTEQLATDFFNCYDAAPAGGRAIYTQCQVETGAVMNTTEGIKKTCQTLYNFPKYAKCLYDGFNAAGIDMNTAVKNVNICEEKVLGTGGFA